MVRFCQILSLFALMTVYACSNQSPNSPDNEAPPTLPDLSTLSITLPQNAPADIQAMIFAANSLTGTGYAYLNAVTDTQPTHANGQWVWKYNNGSLTITLTATVSADSVHWQLQLDGTETASNTQFNNWTVMTGASSLDGKNGTLVIYNINSTQVAGNATWQTDDQDNLTVNLTADVIAVEASGNQNGSGNMTIQQSGVKIYEATWTSTGGSWTSYDPATGQQKDSGTW